MISRVLALCALLGSSVVSPAQKKDLFDDDTFRTIELKFSQTDYKSQIINNKASETYISADMIVDGTTYKNVGVRGRGGQTWYIGKSTGKLPLRISLDNFVPGQRLLGRRSLVLGVCYERSFLREALTFRVMRKYIPAPKANFVKLVVNGASWGVYLNIEAMNQDFLKDWFVDPEGNRYKGLGFGAFGSDPNRYKGQQLMTTPRPDSYIDLATAIGRLNLTGTRHEAEVPIGIDVDAMHRYLACNSFLTVGDTFPRHNFYMYVDPYHNQFSVLPWDVNYSWAGAIPNYNPIWLGGVSSSAWFLRYQAHLRNLAEELDINELKKWIADYHALCLAEMKKETMWFFPTANLVNEANWIVSMATTLRANVLKALGTSAVSFTGHTRTPLQPNPADPVWVTVTAKSSTAISNVLLHSRSRGYFKETAMFDDGKHRDGLANDGIYGVEIPAGLHRKFEYYFSATLATSAAFHPSRAAANAYDYSSFKVDRSGPLISEFLAGNVTGLKDEKGEREDWIELFNPTKTTIDLSGMHLSDDVENLKLWKIPTLTMQPGERVLIWADDETNEGPFHAGFKLGLSEGAIYLTDTDGVTLRDFIEYENQIPDISTARLFDKISAFVTLKPPTPMQPNELFSCGSRLFGAADRGAPSIQLGFIGTPRTNSNVSFEFFGAAPNGTFLMMLGLAPDSYFVPPLGAQLHIGGPLVASFLVPANALGTASIPMTVLNDPALDGFHLTFQALSVKDRVVVASNGLELRFCK